MRRLGLLLGVCLLAAACSGDSTGVGMDARMFVPQTLRVKAGATVTFDNNSNEAHTVTALEDEIPEGAEYFASGDLGSEDEARENIADGLIDPGEGYEVTLDTPGTYSYVCLPHEQSGMAGKIIVER